MSIFTLFVFDFGFDLSYYKRSESDTKFEIEPCLRTAGFTVYIYSISISIFSPIRRSMDRRKKLSEKYYGDLNVKL